MRYAVFMKDKISHQGIARAAKYAQKAMDSGDVPERALARGKSLELKGMLKNDGSVQKIHPDERRSSSRRLTD
jgi:hypothetical protein